MANLLAGFKRPLVRKYNLWRLLDQRWFKDLGKADGSIHVICDIDKTYLETEFETLAKMAKIAFEEASDKVTVPGAPLVLRAFRWGNMDSPLDAQSALSYPKKLHFVTSSPPQLRKVVEEKMQIDGLDWTSDTFKNQAYNLRKGRFDLLKQQVAYKSAAILRIIANAKPGANFILIGDCAEADPFIYLAIKLFCEGYVRASGFIELLKVMGVEEEIAKDIFLEIDPQLKSEIAGIFIRKLPGYHFKEPNFGIKISGFEDYFHLGLFFIRRGWIEADAIMAMAYSFHNECGFSLDYISFSLEQVSTLCSDAIKAAIIEIVGKLRAAIETPCTLPEFASSLLLSLKDEPIRERAKEIYYIEHFIKWHENLS